MTDSTNDTKTCPWCAETIKATAIVCRYCDREMPGAPPGPDEPEVRISSVTYIEPPQEPEPTASVVKEPWGAPGNCICWVVLISFLLVAAILIVLLVILLRQQAP